jgi:hypothetical protein
MEQYIYPLHPRKFFCFMALKLTLCFSTGLNPTLLKQPYLKTIILSHEQFQISEKYNL